MEDYEGIWGGSLIKQGFGHRAVLSICLFQLYDSDICGKHRYT